MYSESDIADITGQLRRRTIFLLAVEALLLAALLASFFARVQWLSAALLSLMAVFLMAYLQTCLLPVRRYLDFLKNAVYGKTRQDALVLGSVETRSVMREGVRVYPVLMLAEHTKEGMEQRQYYFDANLPLPAWQQGERLKLTSHERMITAWERPAA